MVKVVPFEILPMSIVSGAIEVNMQKIAVPTDNYNLIARNLCGGFHTALEYIEGQNLPVTVLALDDLSLSLNGQYASGLEGIYRLKL